MSWLLVFHILGFIFWAGALLDVSRILGYHVKEELNVQQRLSFMEGRMFWFVATPGLVLTLIMGLILLMKNWGTYGGWMHVKLTAIVGLMVIHFLIGKNLLSLKKEPRQMKPAIFKALHGICGLLVVTIIIMVKVRPF